MVDHYSVNTYNDFVQELVRLSRTNNRVLALFCGALDSHGQSWCPDCRNAIPVIQSIIQDNRVSNVPLSYLFVGINRDEWKDPNNRYRSDENLRLTNVPTLVCWEAGREVARLVESECSIPELVVPFFKHKTIPLY